MMSKSHETAEASNAKPESAPKPEKAPKSESVSKPLANVPTAASTSVPPLASGQVREKSAKPVITGAKVKITLTRSLIGRTQTQRKVARALGFTKTHQTVEHAATPVILGMVNAISHLVSVEQVG